MVELTATKRRMQRPTKEELLLFLKKRITADYSSSFAFIRDADVYAESPDQLTRRFSNGEVQREWYFFTRVTPKRSSATKTKGRVSRVVAGHGTWRGTQKVNYIKDVNGKVIGSKKSFDYVLKRSGTKVEKTIWLMEEFSLNDLGEYFEQEESNWKLEQWVLCKIYVTPRAHPKPLSCCDNGNDHNGTDRFADKSPTSLPTERNEMDIVEVGSPMQSAVTEQQVRPYTALLNGPYLHNDPSDEDLQTYLHNLPPIIDLPPLDTDISMDF